MLGIVGVGLNFDSFHISIQGNISILTYKWILDLELQVRVIYSKMQNEYASQKSNVWH